MCPPFLSSAAGESAGTMTASRKAEAAACPTSFRVFFSDGEHEIPIGDAAVDGGLAFRKFQFLISDMIGVSPHQIALYLVRQKKGRPSQEGRRRVLIDEGTDFAAMAREKDCLILAQLKRTRRDRRGRGRRGHGAGGGARDEIFPVTQVPEKRILRWPDGIYGSVTAPEDGSNLMGMFNYEGLRNLQLHRERYLLSTASVAAVLHQYSGSAVSPPLIRDPPMASAVTAVCGICTAATEKPAPFHCCIYDKVVSEGFRSSVGPIERPPKFGPQTLI